MSEPSPPDRLAPACLILLAIALHGRGLLTGFADQDLKALETVMVTPFPALLQGGAFTGGFTPLSRELHLWWWGKALGLDALGFHLLAAALAASAGALLHRAVAKGAGARAGLLAVGLMVAFAPLGTALASVAAGRELVVLLLCALAIHAWTRRRWILLGLACGLAALSRETALLLPFAFVVADRFADPGARAADRARRLLPAFVGVAVALTWLFVAPGAARSGPGGALWILPDFMLAWMPRGSLAGLGSVWRAAPWWLVAVLVLAVFTVPRPRARPAPPERGAPSLSRRGRPASQSSSGATTPLASVERAIMVLGAAILVLGLASVAFAPAPRGAEIFMVPALGASVMLGVELARGPRGLALALLAAPSLASLGANWGAPSAGVAVAAPPAERARFTAAGRLQAEAARTGPWIAALKPVCDELATAPLTFAVGVSPDSTMSLALGPGARVACRGSRSIRFLAEMTPAEAAALFAVLRYEPQAKRFVYEPAGPPIRARIGEGLLLYSRHEAAAASFEAAAAEAPDARELGYPLVISLAAAGRTEDARRHWRDARAEGVFPSADTLAGRLMAGVQASDAQRKTTARLAAAVIADPTAAAPHLALGRHLLELGLVRSAAIELAVGSGISRKSQDLYWLARAYDAMGASSEALESYRIALSGGLESTEYSYARARLVELLRTLGVR